MLEGRVISTSIWKEPVEGRIPVRGVNGALIGERWAIGSALLEVRQSRMPCFKLGLRIGDPRFVRTFAQTDRPGAYLGILREGDVGAGDAVEIVHRPEHEVTVALMHRALLQDHDLLPELLAAPELIPEWRAFVEDRLGRGGAGH